MGLYLLYIQITEPGAGTGVNVMIGYVVVATWAFKATLSLKALSHYKHITSHTKKERIIFIAGYCLNVFFSGILLMDIFIVIPQDILQKTGYHGSLQLTDILLDALLFIATVCSAYIGVFDLLLLKAIRNKQLDNLLSFETNNIEPI